MARLNPFDPETQHTAAVAWAEQLDAGVRERSENLLEEELHRAGLCSKDINDVTLVWLDLAMQYGAVAMSLELMRLGRLKED